MKYDLIASDWDGTLAAPNRAVTERTQEAIAAFQEQGGTFVVCSGRPVGGVLKAASRSEFDLSDAIIIGSNGTEVARGNGEILETRTLEYELAAGLWNKGLELGLVPIALSSDAVYTTDPHYPPVTEDIEQNAYSFSVHDPAETLPVDDYLKLMVTGHPRVPDADIEVIRELYGDHVEATLSTPYFYEATKLGVSKGPALRDLCGDLGIDLQRVMAFGDNFNDLTLIQAAGTGIAVGNAVPELKQVADRITLSNGEDGVAVVIEEVIRTS